jgi:hypothetical protein
MIWRRKQDRLPQPPISAAARDPERHDFWPGAVLVLIGIILLACGTGRLTGLETADGQIALEHQLIKSFAYGGLQLAGPPEPPDPAQFDDPAEMDAAMQRFFREERERPRMKYVVNTGAVDPCPT